jgi:hypothetical protein
MTSFERREADQDLRGKNILAASAPQHLTDIAVDALDQHLLSLQRQQQQLAMPSMMLTIFSSPLVRDRDFRLRFARADRLDPVKACTRLIAYLSLSVELFGDIGLTRPIRTTDFHPADEQALRNGWIQYLLTRDNAGRRIVALDDLGPTEIPIESKVIHTRKFLCSIRSLFVLTIHGSFLSIFVDLPWQMRAAFFVLQAASTDAESQKQGVQLVIQIFNPATSAFLNDSSTRRKFRRLFSCSPVRFSTVHVCFPSTVSSSASSSTSDPASECASEEKAPATTRGPYYEAVSKATATLLGKDERVRTKFHQGMSRLWKCVCERLFFPCPIMISP